jgi:hypothetical protein
MHALVIWCEGLLNISSFLLAAEDSYDSQSCWYFKAQVCRMQSSFECIQESPSKDGVIWVHLVNHVEGDVFGAGVLGSAKGHWECDGSDGLDSFSAKAVERLRRFPELLPIEFHFVEGC